MKLPKETLHRFVPHHQAMDYVRLGWLPLPSLRQTPHDAYSVHVIWLCDCEPTALTEDNLDIAIARARIAEAARFPERLISGAALEARLRGIS